MTLGFGASEEQETADIAQRETVHKSRILYPVRVKCGLQYVFMYLGGKVKTSLNFILTQVATQSSF